jgi:hypothetical protein
MTSMSRPKYLLAEVSGSQAHLPAAIVLVLVLAAAFDLYCLIDLIRARSVHYLPKLAWAIVIVAVSAPVGGLVYLFLGKDRGRGSAVPE